MKKYIVLAGFIFLSGWAWAQNGRIVAEKMGKGAVLTHEVQPKEGLYAIARSYNLSISELAAANKLDKDASLRIGQKLKVPLQPLEQTRFGTGAPVYYVVEGKENLKAVSNRFSKMPVKNIMIWNNLKEGEEVRKGQEIIVGYLPKGVGVTAQKEAVEAPKAASKKSSSTKQHGVVKGTNINIRKGPSTNEQVVGVAQLDETVEITKKVDGEWSAIRTSAGVEGFVASRFLELKEAKASTTPARRNSNKTLPTAIISGTNINIRKGPSTDQEVVAIAQQDEVVEVLKKVNAEWTSIRTQAGVEGYMAAQFLQNTDGKTATKNVAQGKKATVYGSNINIRKGPATDQQVVGIAQQDEVLVLVKTVDAEWAEIRTGEGTEGFIASKFLSVDGKPALAAIEAEQQAEAAKKVAAETAASEKAIADAQKKQEDQKAEALVSEKITTKQTDEASAAIDESGYFKKDYEQAVNPNFTSEKTFASGIFKTDRGWNDGKYYLLMDNVAAGTLVKITNPANNKMIYAKVLGQMKGVQYSDGFDIRISEAAARKLQMEDMDRFNVAVTY